MQMSNNNYQFTSEEQDIVDMAKLSEQQQEDNPDTKTVNNNSALPDPNNNQADF